MKRLPDSVTGVPEINTRKKKSKDRQASWKGSIFTPIVLLCLNLFIFGAITVYLGNQGEFLVEDEDVLLVLLLPALATIAMLSALTFPLFRLKPLATSAVLFFLAFITYVHGNLLRWDTGILDGAALQTGKVWPILADALVWLLLGWLVWKFRRWLSLHGWKICILLMLFQLVGAVDLKRNAKVGNLKLQEVPEQLYAFHNGPNVVHIIVDGFQGNVFESLVEENPGIAEDLQGFVFFRDTLTTSAVTYLSVPATLSGKAFDNSVSITQFQDETLGGDNLYSFLAANGHEIDVASPVWWNLDRDYFASYYRVPAPFASLADTIRTTAWYLLDISLFRQAPYLLKPAIYRNGVWLFSSELSKHPEQKFQHFAHSAFLADLTARANVQRASPTYKLVHIITPHAPLVSNPDCSFTGRELEGQFEPYADQSLCSLRTVQSLLRRLRELDIYDDALVIIHGDHGGGVAFDMVSPDGPSSSFEALPGEWGNPLPLLLVKPPRAEGKLEISDRLVSLVDVPATVADLLGKQHAFPGHSMFSDEPATYRRMYYSSTQHRNEAAEKGRFANFTSYAVDGSIFDTDSWSRLEQFEVSAEELSGQYAWGTPLTFGRSGSFKPFGDGGWTVTRGSEVNWTQGKETGLLIPLPGSDRDLRMSFTIRPLLAPGKLDRQRVRVTVNGEDIAQLELSENRFKTHEVIIPARLIEEDLISVRFHLPDAASPLSLGSGEDARELALAFVKFQIDPVD